MQTLRDLYTTKYAPQNLKLRAKSTKNHYRIMLKHLDEFLGRPATADDLRDDTAAAYAAWLLTGKRGVITVNQRLNYLRALWNWLAKRGIVGKFPTIGNLPEPARVPRAWTEKQLSRLLRACEKMPGKISGVPAGNWWVAIHLVWWDTGERTEATLALKWAWLDLDTGALDVQPEARKGRSKGMLYVLRPDTLATLRAMRSPERELIFPWPTSVSSFYGAYGRLLKLADLPSDRRCKPQKMRRSFASHVEANGGNATEALGHSARKVTVKSYLDPSICCKSPPNLLLPRIAPPEAHA